MSKMDEFVTVDNTEKFKALDEESQNYIAQRMSMICNKDIEDFVYDYVESLEKELLLRKVDPFVFWKICDYRARLWKSLMTINAKDKNNGKESLFLEHIIPVAESYNEAVVEQYSEEYREEYNEH